jgi:putative tricarboxylic transport membrane protein
MTIDAHGSPSTAETEQSPDFQADTSAGFMAGRSGLVVAGILALIGTYLTMGIVTMDVPAGAKAPGPTFFPILITIAVFVLAALLAVQTLRKPEHVQSTPGNHRFHTDWKALALVFAAFLAFAILLVPAGWLISAALLFWGVSRALGSTKPLFDLGLSLVFSACIQLAFGAGLGLNLPGGILEGIYG